MKERRLVDREQMESMLLAIETNINAAIHEVPALEVDLVVSLLEAASYKCQQAREELTENSKRVYNTRRYAR